MKKFGSLLAIALLALAFTPSTQAQSPKGGEQQIAASGSIVKLDDTAKRNLWNLF